MGYLIDTDWTIHWLNGNEAVHRRVEEARRDMLCLSMVSLAELWEGVFYSRNPDKNATHLQNFVQGVTLLGLDPELCQLFGRERGRLRQQGKLIADFDLLIASTALRHNLTLLTQNRRDFEVVQGVRLESF